MQVQGAAPPVRSGRGERRAQWGAGLGYRSYSSLGQALWEHDFANPHLLLMSRGPLRPCGALRTVKWPTTTRGWVGWSHKLNDVHASECITFTVCLSPMQTPGVTRLPPLADLGTMKPSQWRDGLRWGYQQTSKQPTQLATLLSLSFARAGGEDVRTACH